MVRVRGVVVSAAFDSGNEGLEYCLRTKPDLLAVDLFFARYTRLRQFGGAGVGECPWDVYGLGASLGSGAYRAKAVAKRPSSGGAGREFGDKVGLDAPSIAIAPDRAKIGREIGRERQAAQVRMR